MNCPHSGRHNLQVILVQDYIAFTSTLVAKEEVVEGNGERISFYRDFII